MKYLVYAIILFNAALFVSCSSTDVSKEGRIKVYLTDAPASLDSVLIHVVSVEAHMSGGDWFTISDTSGYFDLLQITNGASVVLGDQSLAAGKYTQIRLILGDDNYVYDSGVKHDLVIPSGSETGLKLTHQFTIEPDNLYELYLDFDADKSIEVTGTGVYQLKPTIRVEAGIISGSISGIVLPLDAVAKVWTVSGTDTVTAFPDQNGFFKLICLREGSYQVHIDPSNGLYQPAVIDNVTVTSQQNTDLGTITLTSN